MLINLTVAQRHSLEIGVSVINGSVVRSLKTNKNALVVDTVTVTHKTLTLSKNVCVTKDFLVDFVNWIRILQITLHHIQIRSLLIMMATVSAMNMTPTMIMTGYQMFSKSNIPDPMLVHGNLPMIEEPLSVHE